MFKVFNMLEWKFVGFKLIIWGIYFVYYQLLVKCISFQHVALATIIQFDVQLFFLARKFMRKVCHLFKHMWEKLLYYFPFKSCDLSNMLDPTFPMHDVFEQNIMMLVENTLVEFVKWNKSTRGIGSSKMLT
jgi:hypothetical protein